MRIYRTDIRNGRRRILFDVEARKGSLLVRLPLIGEGYFDVSALRRFRRGLTTWSWWSELRRLGHV